MGTSDASPERWTRATHRGSKACATRRELLPLLCSLTAASKAETFRYDLIVKGGRVIDPSQSLSAPRDVAIAGNKIARVDANIPAAEGRITIDARGKIVTPGLVDIHVHV